MITTPVCDCGGKDFCHITVGNAVDWFTVYCDRCMALYDVIEPFDIFCIMKPNQRRMTDSEMKEIWNMGDERKGGLFQCKGIIRTINCIDP